MICNLTVAIFCHIADVQNFFPAAHFVAPISVAKFFAKFLHFPSFINDISSSINEKAKAVHQFFITKKFYGAKGMKQSVQIY